MRVVVPHAVAVVVNQGMILFTFVLPLSKSIITLFVDVVSLMRNCFAVKYGVISIFPLCHFISPESPKINLGVSHHVQIFTSFKKVFKPSIDSVNVQVLCTVSVSSSFIAA